MFNVGFYRQPQGFQENIQVEVMKPEDERYFKRHGIQIDLEDMTFKCSLKARMLDGREVGIDKINESMSDAFSRLRMECEAVNSIVLQ